MLGGQKDFFPHIGTSAQWQNAKVKREYASHMPVCQKEEEKSDGDGAKLLILDSEVQRWSKAKVNLISIIVYLSTQSAVIPIILYYSTT